MRYDHRVKVGDTYYMAGEEVPDVVTAREAIEVPRPAEPTKEPTKPEPIEPDEPERPVEAESLKQAKPDTAKEKPSEPTGKISGYTKNDISHMPTAELQKLGMESGIEGADRMTGIELKKLLIGMLAK